MVRLLANSWTWLDLEYQPSHIIFIFTPFIVANSKLQETLVLKRSPCGGSRRLKRPLIATRDVPTLLILKSHDNNWLGFDIV